MTISAYVLAAKQYEATAEQALQQQQAAAAAATAAAAEQLPFPDCEQETGPCQNRDSLQIRQCQENS